MKKASFELADYIHPLNINGLAGRMMYIPSPQGKKREILLIYGHHSSLERMSGIAEYLSRFGNVTIPDLPGFGGMDPFYKIGQTADLDSMADYLSSFIKLRYKNKQITIVGLSLGFTLVTKTLQKYPEVAKKVDLLISVVGLVNKDDLAFSKRIVFTFRWGSSFFSHMLTAGFLKYFVLRKPQIVAAYAVVERIFIKDSHSKIRNVNEQERKKRINFEVELWKINDIRTYMSMGVAIMTLNLTNQRVNLPVYHVYLDNDMYFDHTNVEVHMRQVYNDYIPLDAKAPSHTPSIIAEAKDVAHYIPPKLRKILNQDPK